MSAILLNSFLILQVYYRLSLLASKMRNKADLVADMARCNAERIDPEWISMDEENLLLLLLQKCLPLAYGRKDLYRFISASSTAACPETSGKDRSCDQKHNGKLMDLVFGLVADRCR